MKSDPVGEPWRYEVPWLVAAMEDGTVRSESGTT
jgi:hypothetical protein